MKTKINLSLYIKFKNPKQEIKFSVFPPPMDAVHESEGIVYHFDLDPLSIFNLSVTVTTLPIGSAVIIYKITLNDTILNYLDSFGVYKTDNGTKRTYGYMDEKGTYQFKIRYNVLSQNYLMFLLNS